MTKSFLGIATEFNFNRMSEGRLSQIIVAACAHSTAFKRSFLNFLGANGEYEVIREEAGRGRDGTRIRYDFVLKNQINNESIYVESKIEDRVNAQKLRNRRRNQKHRRYILITKYACWGDRVPIGWEHKLWSDLPKFFQINAASVVDKWIMQDVRQLLNEYGITSMPNLTSEDLTVIGVFLKSLRFDGKMNQSFKKVSPLGALHRLEEFLLAGFELFSSQYQLRQRFGKEPNPSVRLMWWNPDFGEDSDEHIRQLSNRRLGQKRRSKALNELGVNCEQEVFLPCIGMWVALNKPYKRVKSVQIALLISPTDKPCLSVALMDQNELFIGETVLEIGEKGCEPADLAETMAELWSKELDLRVISA